MSELLPMRCSEHGIVMHASPLRSTGCTVTGSWFCPICRRELFADDALGEIERAANPERTYESWKQESREAGIPVLELQATDRGEDSSPMTLPVRCCDLWPECSHVLAVLTEGDQAAGRVSADSIPGRSPSVSAAWATNKRNVRIEQAASSDGEDSPPDGERGA